MRQPSLVSLATAVALAGSVAMAQDGPTPEEWAVSARQSHMTLYQHNLMIIGGMAQGSVPYDQTAAQAAAANLEHLVQLDQARYWLPGTSSEEIEESRALPAIWDNMEDFEAKHAGLEEAVTGLVTAAGADQAALGPALGAVGQACGACHQAYREPQG